MKDIKKWALSYLKKFSDVMHGNDGIYEYDSLFIG